MAYDLSVSYAAALLNVTIQQCPSFTECIPDADHKIWPQKIENILRLQQTRSCIA